MDEKRKQSCGFALVLTLFFICGCAPDLIMSGIQALEVAKLGGEAVSMAPESRKGAVAKEQEKVFYSDMEKSWKIVVQSLTELNVPILNSNKSDGLMVTDYVPIGEKVFGEKVLYKGFAERVETGRYKLNISLSAFEDGKVKVSVRPTIEKYVQYPHSSSMKPEWKPQESNGVIERGIFKAMAAKAESEGVTVKAFVAPVPKTALERWPKGNWQGQVAQPGGVSYPAIINLTDLSAESACGSTEYTYKNIKCAGSLTYAGLEGDEYTLNEKIESGKCANSVIHLKKTDEKSLKLEWFSTAGKKEAEAILYAK